jgi:hypothetical protein
MKGHPLMTSALGLATGGRPIGSGEDLVCLARALVLLALEEGPRASGELPRSWPVTRVLLRAASRELVREGLVAEGGDGPRAPLSLTPQGRNALLVVKGELRRSA